ncbi:hypothetical protein PMM47T1_24169 [Pseudomonas sp. M47T1]|uniref:hypothetical protein n=1 Tax=Pseudomonas sp. M47T1 TaxID=1179778 RepID=UPI0002607E09|nr:hypothetical protein [Pseudomonas sp. M47T1]EIK94046.1 hypothetical protein PMM47T1_24169 [Pseudomonas sp. M47T1]
MKRQPNGPLGRRLMLLWQLLQQPTTTFGEVLILSAACGIDGRQVLANHFSQPAFNADTMEA